MTGFFEESEGVRSMTRLILFVTIGLAGVVVVATCLYLLLKLHPEAGVIVSMTSMLSALVAGGIVAIINRNGGTDAA